MRSAAKLPTDLPQPATRTALLLFAVSLNALEFFLPRIPFLPWLKPGLANAVTIIWIMRYGTADALLYSLMRIWIVGYFFGFSVITVALSLSGAVASTLAMGMVWRLLGIPGLIGTCGIGIVGALFHNAGQLAMVYLLLARNLRIFYQVPFMLAASVLFGGLVGIAAGYARELPNRHHHSMLDLQAVRGEAAATLAARHVLFSSLIFAVSIGIVVVSDVIALVVVAGAATFTVQVIRRGSLTDLLYPLRRFWILFVFVAGVHIFLSYGRPVAGFPWATYEGLGETGIQWLRIWTWLQLSMLLKDCRFHTVFLAALSRLFPGNRATVLAGLLSLEHFPQTVELARQKGPRAVGYLLRHPRKTMHSGIPRLYETIVNMVADGNEGAEESGKKAGAATRP